jgi:hypothetical protein
VKAITGTAHYDAPKYSKDDPYWTIREAVSYECSDPELSGWTEIHDRMFPLCEDILARTAQTPTGLAIQVWAITFAAADLWDDPEANEHALAFIKAVRRFVGITGAKLTRGLHD